MFLKPPGWRPAELGGFQGPVQRDRASYHKWDTRAAAGVNGYVAFQFVVAVAVTSFFLFRQGDRRGRSWAMAAGIIWTVMDLGVLLEGKRWGWWLELARLASLVVRPAWRATSSRGTRAWPSPPRWPAFRWCGAFSCWAGMAKGGDPIFGGR